MSGAKSPFGPAADVPPVGAPILWTGGVPQKAQQVERVTRRRIYFTDGTSIERDSKSAP